ncbi:threonine aldolase family protein [Myroides pelagicus]|uniref:Aminotransferase class V-fold PLP-dependent enzyme n=1 Tax=Myroides pelagicus TaxID=270914 RepID=A0A7K1GQ16_9FLAO|nr:aminotransferase class I/II-fold pyridoxal phosphate-dependent enzyme [Myroides pelagicus]MEC4113468.1 aminotransferase class I/II-fold pyridoxal phosphate-dependent enzyme [Myroides pelagicus]MTH31002.1 aminotransferase class V-fold PLP-dependent enzyme [Myroides pelagicus]
MYSFKNDYSEGCHPSILDKLVETNLVQDLGYAEDRYTKLAKEILREEMKSPAAEIYFVSGGTQSNLLVLSSLLLPHQAVISAHTGHIYANETGAIEATGHKVIPVQTTDGKLTASAVEQVVRQHGLRPHVVQPKVVYISNSTEIGTIYTKQELSDLSQCCKKNDLYLFVDGARLGHALTAHNNDLTLADLAALVDVFYIGGTKNGALLGEAIVFSQETLANYFDYNLKQRGALLAKGRIVGIQFLCLFTDHLYFDLARHANDMAYRIQQALQEAGYAFSGESTTNQLFPILPKSLIEKLQKQFDFYVWAEVDEYQSIIRLITSWATDEAAVDQFIHAIKE